MAENFYTILTDIGLAKVANSQITQEKIDFVEVAVGDGGGSYYNPSSNQTSLVNEVWRGPIGLVGIDENNENWIKIESAIQANDGGFFIREVGLFDADGDLVAVGKYPETYKPKIDEGSSKDLYIRMIIEVSNAAAITLKVDPTVIIATRKYVDDKLRDLEQTEIIMSAIEPVEPTKKTWWYEDLGESYDLGGGGGLVIANASLDGTETVWFDSI